MYLADLQYDQPNSAGFFRILHAENQTQRSGVLGQSIRDRCWAKIFVLFGDNLVGKRVLAARTRQRRRNEKLAETSWRSPMSLALT